MGCIRSRLVRLTLVALGLTACASSSPAAIVWNESISGDLSNNQALPSTVTLGLGVNSVLGTVGGGNSQDWITLNIPAGLQLTSIKNTVYTSSDAQGFTGFQAGTAFVGNPLTQPGAYLGYIHYGTGAKNGSLPVANLVNVELMTLLADNVKAAPGAKGFTPPLGAGSYTFLIQQQGALTTYQFDYTTVAVIPEPSSLCLLGVLCAAGVVRRATRRGTNSETAAVATCGGR